MHRLFGELLALVPPDGSPWPRPARERWLAAMAAVLDVVYEDYQGASNPDGYPAAEQPAAPAGSARTTSPFVDGPPPVQSAEVERPVEAADAEWPVEAADAEWSLAPAGPVWNAAPPAQERRVPPPWQEEDLSPWSADDAGVLDLRPDPAEATDSQGRHARQPPSD